jgi:rhodanese-related sulfurtransferase
MSFVDEVKNREAQLLDVRDNEEWKSGHASGAIHIQSGAILEGEFGALDKAKPIYVYCESGERSSMAEFFLNDNGFNAINIGGLKDWVEAGGETEKGSLI